jgi:glycerol kinase
MSSTSQFVLSLDQGTTSSRAIVFGRDGRPTASAQQEFPQIYPSPGHVEHDPEQIWSTQLATAKEAIQKAGLKPNQLVAIGVTNQRETTIVWDKKTGKPIANAIVWQSRITAPECERLKREGCEPLVQKKTGLVLDAYFSATKIAHLLKTVNGARAAAEKGDLLFGTVDSFLIWRLTGGKLHVTDVSNASRTSLFNIHTLGWDDELLKLFGVPRAMLPGVRASSEIYGSTDASLLGAEIPIAGIAGDQQAATFGQACFDVGESKNTYGTGCFMLLNTGDKPAISKNGLITTIGWKIGDRVTYCLEGAVFIAGAAVQWLRDGLGLIEKSSDVEALAAQVKSSEGVYLAPAFVGLGAPYWNPNARGTITGITRGTTRAHIARATLDSMAFQTRDVLEAMQNDSGVTLAALRVDGGASANNLMMQFQADLLGTPVQRPVVQETTALGAAYLAGLAVGYWTGFEDLKRNWALDREFTPRMGRAEADRLYAGWKCAVQSAIACGGGDEKD